MKTNTIQKLLLCFFIAGAAVMLSFTPKAHTSTNKKVVAKASFTIIGTPRDAIAGSNYLYPDNSVQFWCADPVTVYVVNSTDYIATGTHIYLNLHCTTPWPDGILISNSGYTTGNPYWVQGGVVMGYATPC